MINSRKVFLFVLGFYYIVPFQIKALGINLPLGLPDLDFERFLFIILFAVVIMWRRKNGKLAGHLTDTVLLKVLIVYILATALSSGVPSYYLLKFIKNWFIPLIFLYCFYIIFYKEEQLQKLIGFFSLVSLFLVFYSIVEFATKTNIFYQIPNYAGIETYTVYHGGKTALAGIAGRGLNIFRTTGPYYDWAPFGTVMAMLSPIFLSKFFLERSKKHLILSFIAAFAVFLTFTRSAILIMVLGYAMASLNMKSRNKYFAPTLIFVLIASVLFLFSDEILESDIVKERFLKYETIESRYQKWMIINEIINDPTLLMFGVHFAHGKNYLDDAGTRYRQGKHVYSGSHQLYLNYLFEYGLVGLLLYLAVVMKFALKIRVGYKRSKKKFNRNKTAIYLFSLSIIGLYHIATIFFYNTILNPLLWIGIGVGLKQLELDSKLVSK